MSRKYHYKRQRLLGHDFTDRNAVLDGTLLRIIEEGPGECAFGEWERNTLSYYNCCAVVNSWSVHICTPWTIFCLSPVCLTNEWGGRKRGRELHFAKCGGTHLARLEDAVVGKSRMWLYSL